MLYPSRRPAAVPTVLALLALAPTLGVPAAARAQIFTETIDAGSTLPTAVVLPGGITTVVGTIDFGGDTDLFAFFFDTAGTAQFDLGDSVFDNNLLLFNAAGQGLGASDDRGGSPFSIDSRITISLAPGLYYIGAGVNNTAAFTDGGVQIFDDDSGDGDGVLPAPTVQTIGFIGPETGPSSAAGGYTLRFNFATAPAADVPEPGTLALLAPALLPLLGRFRRRRFPS